MPISAVDQLHQANLINKNELDDATKDELNKINQDEIDALISIKQKVNLPTVKDGGPAAVKVV